MCYTQRNMSAEHPSTVIAKFMSRQPEVFEAWAQSSLQLAGETTLDNYRNFVKSWEAHFDLCEAMGDFTDRLVPSEICQQYEMEEKQAK